MLSRSNQTALATAGGDETPHALAGASGLVDLDQYLSPARLSAGHWFAAIGCFLVLLVDTYDLHVAGQLLPVIAGALKVPVAALAAAFAAQTTGQAVGAFAISPFADRVGRKPVMLAALLVFGLGTLATPLVESTRQFAIVRFGVGVFGGALLPVAASIVADLAPTRWRSTLVGLGLAGIIVGPLVASTLIGMLLDTHGWQLFFEIGGAAPLVLILPVLLLVPESPRFLALRGGKDARIISILRKLRIDLPPDSRFAGRQPSQAAPIPIVELFQERRALLTSALWAAASFSLISITLFGFASTFFHEFAGISIAKLAAILALGLAAGLLSGLLVPVLMDRLGPYRIVGAYAAGGALAIAALGFVPFGTPAFIGALVLAGFFSTGTQQALNIITPGLYPASMRAAATGWKGGVSRMASSAAPLLAAALLSGKIGLSGAMLCTAAPLLVVALLTPWLARGTVSSRTVGGFA